MKKMTRWLLLFGWGVAGIALPTMAGDTYDLFTYENKFSSFTVDVDTSKYNRFSVQLVYSTSAATHAQFTGADVNVTHNTIYEPSHSFAPGQPVHLATAALTAPTPLTSGTTYFIIKLSDNLIQLATTYTQAVAGEEIDILSSTSAPLTLIPIALNLGNAGILWYASNDGSNYLAVSVSTQSLTAMGPGTRLFDFGEFAYRFMRLDFRGPIAGAIRLRAVLSGRKE